MPPGLGDETLDVIRLIKRSEFLIVTTPSKVSMGAVNKLLRILKELKLPIIGIIENMKMKSSEFVNDSVLDMDLNYLGAINFDHDLEEAIGNTDKLFNSDFMKDFGKIIKNNI